MWNFAGLHVDDIPANKEVMPVLCSTIIPTVSRPCLERAVKSALDQNLDPDLHEIIVINDSGNPLPVWDWLKSPQITIVNTNRCERSVAQTMGAAVARGKYIKILQDDDYLLPGALKALIEVAEDTGCYWIYGATNRVDDNDVFMSVNRPEVKGNLFAHSVAGDSFHLSASLIRRDIFFEVGGFDPTINTSEDLDLQWRIALIGDFSRTDQLVAGIRVGVWGNTTTKWSKKREDTRIVRERALNAPGALSTLLDSVKNDVNLRGRCCRAYLVSTILNLQAGRYFIAMSRVFPLFRLAGPYVFLPKLWQGILTRSHWHKFEKIREEEHFKTHYPDMKIESQKW
jgi:glycosyltransferase involved in cell wall biosynthesis